jgi:hypothetical protein
MFCRGCIDIGTGRTDEKKADNEERKRRNKNNKRIKIYINKTTILRE